MPNWTAVNGSRSVVNHKKRMLNSVLSGKPSFCAVCFSTTTGKRNQRNPNSIDIDLRFQLGENEIDGNQRYPTPQ